MARPDLRHPRIVLAGCRALPTGDGDDDGLVGALRARGLHARWLPWDDPETLDADLVILRTTWDYARRLPEFLAWTRRVHHLVNGPDAVAWNTRKTYLADLDAAGVPIVESHFFAPGERVVIPGAGCAEVVVKPAVGAGSVDARRFADPAGALAHAERLQARGSTALVQPYDGRIADGETALVFLSGEPSHAFTKGPVLPPPGTDPELDASGTFTTEVLRPADPGPELWQVGRTALAAAARHLQGTTGDLLYARVDVIGAGNDPRLLELELVEPSLGWRQLASGERAARQREFALGVASALQRRGLGPLSHRGV